MNQSAVVSAIIVTYFPDTLFEERLKRISNQVSQCIVIDNSSNTAVQDRLRIISSEKVELLFNSRNIGLGAALNQGVILAKKMHSDYVLFFDQDSQADDDIVEKLREIYDLSKEQVVGVVGANFRSIVSGRLGIRCAKGRVSREVETVITSGSLLSISVYDAVGPFREDFFIECIDLEYCLRLRRHGYAVVISCRPLMTHAAGKMRETRLFGRSVLLSDHEPRRYYYMMRNFFILMRIYSFSEFSWISRACLNHLKMCAKILFYEQGRISKMKDIVVGCRDGAIAPLKKDMYFLSIKK